MPRMGMGMPIAAPTGRAPALSIVDNGVFEQIVSGEITPEFTTTRTNLTIYSQDVSQNTWTKSNVAVDGTAVEAPNNTTTAQAITGSANTSSRKTSQTTALTAGLTYTYSAYVKAVAFSHVRLSINDGTVEHTQDFNVTNASNGSAGAASNVLRSEIEKLDNNWFRVMLTIQCQNSNSDATYGVLSMAANNTPNVQVAVGGTVLMHVWGQQFEQDIQANAYIATSNTTKTAATALVDVNSVWDFDGTDLVVEADPSDEGFWEAPDNIVLNGDYEELGSELLTNGDFTTDSDWGKGAGWTIANGKASNDGTVGSNNLSQVGILEVDKQYKIDITVSNYVSGNVQVSAGASPRDTMTANGTYTFYQTCTPSTTFYIIATSFNGSIDNVSVKQVDPNDRWTLGTGWSIEDGKLVGTSVSTQFAQQSLTLTSGTSYEVTFSITGADTLLNNNSFRYPYDGAVSNINYLPKDSPDGTYTNVFTSTGSSILYLGYIDAGTFTGTIDNVTVKEYAIQPQDV